MLKSSKGLKRATVIRVPTPLDIPKLEEGVEKLKFRECGKTQEESWGFVPPDDRGNWPLLPRCKDTYVISLRYDRRVLNKSRLSREWHNAIREKEKAEQRKLNKEEREQLRDAAKAKLYPQTAPVEHLYQGIYDTERRLLVVTESGAAAVDFFVDKVNRALGTQGHTIDFQAKNLPRELEHTLTAWAFRPTELPQEYDFEVGTNLRLENQACTAVLSNHDCDSAEVREHLHQQKLVQQIHLVWNETVDFALSSKRVLSKMNFKQYCADGIKEAQDETAEDLRAYQEASFLVFVSAFFELWDAVAKIPSEL